MGEISRSRTLAETQQAPAAVLEILRPTNGAVSPSRPVAAVPAEADIDKRVQAYLTKVGNRPSGERNNTGFQIAAWLRRDMALTEDLAWSYLSLWNTRNTPPLPERELRACFDNGLEHGRSEIGQAINVAPIRAVATRRSIGVEGSNDSMDAPTLGLHERTDADNAGRLADLHGRHIRFVPKWNSWIVWTGSTWKRDERNVALTEQAKGVGREWLRLAADEPNDHARNAMLSWGRSSLSAPRIRSMIELARGIPGIAIDHELLDADPWLLGVQNGIVDLRTGCLRDATPEDLITMQCPVAFDADATAPRWEQALAEWFPDTEVRAYLQRLAGSALVGEQRDHVFANHYGTGRNGKGTFTRAFLGLLGPYGVTPHLSLLVRSKHAEHDTVKASLFRARLAVASETERRVSLEEASVKNLTGGDRITCRRLYENPWQFEPSHSLWLQTNYLPKISGRDRGIWSRIRVVEWKATFSQPDANLDATLASERAGILNWAVQGCLDWKAQGLHEPEAVIRATLAYRQSEDVLARFAADVGLDFTPRSEVVVTALNDAFDAWAQAEGVKIQRSELADWLQENGAEKERRRIDGKQYRCWIGVSIGTEDVTAVTSLPKTFP